MKTLAACVALVAAFSLPLAGAQQATTSYRLEYGQPGDRVVHVTLTPSGLVDAPAAFVFPRNYQGGYSRVPYDSFVTNIHGVSASGAALELTPDAYGPRWRLGKAGERVSRVEYDVDVVRMEQDLHGAVETSKVRPAYVGLLGYSVLGYIDGLERQPTSLTVVGPAGWPVLTTLAPAIPAPFGTATGRAPDFDVLADSQILMGPDLRLRRLGGKIPLVMAVHAEADEDLALESDIARTALDRVQTYFGDTPIHQYTVQLELLRPLAGHDFGFSQEHVDSGTFSLDTSRATTAATPADQRATTLMNYAHHMAHSWVPKRAYGTGYSPFNWEATPIIDTIWFNEGFARCAAIQSIAMGMPPADGHAFRQRALANLLTIVDSAPPFIRRMPLLVLSREASFLYSDDFRFGRNVFARGALMAAEIDNLIGEQTGGAKSLRDAFRFLIERADRTHQPFEVDELPGLIRQATGVNVQVVFERWLAAPEK